MSNYRGFKNSRNYADMSEKVLSALSYLTSGLIGFIWLVVSHIRKKPLSSFAKYHIFQALFLSILLYVTNILLNIIISVIQIIPFLGAFITNIVYYLVQYPLIINYSIVQFGLIVIYIYLASFAFMGKQGRLPVVSDMIKQMV